MCHPIQGLFRDYWRKWNPLDHKVIVLIAPRVRAGQSTRREETNDGSANGSARYLQPHLLHQGRRDPLLTAQVPGLHLSLSAQGQRSDTAAIRSRIVSSLSSCLSFKDIIIGIVTDKRASPPRPDISVLGGHWKVSKVRTLPLFLTTENYPNVPEMEGPWE